MGGPIFNPNFADTSSYLSMQHKFRGVNLIIGRNLETMKRTHQLPQTLVLGLLGKWLCKDSLLEYVCN